MNDIRIGVIGHGFMGHVMDAVRESAQTYKSINFE